MSRAINLKYREISPLFFFVTPLIALFGASGSFKGKKTIPHISVELKGQKLDPDHLGKFNSICGLKNTGEISVIYPLTQVFPLFQRILSLKKAPLNLFKVLGKSLIIEQFKRIGPNDIFDVYCEISDIRVLEKGLDVDLTGIIIVDGEIVWKAVETFFYRGVFGKRDSDGNGPVFDDISVSSEMFSWFLSGKNGFRFALVSGDGNPIHYLDFYAKILGFKKAFAQPFLVLSRAVDHLTLDRDEKVVLEVAFKSQFYYGRDVVVKSENINGKTRFDIYSEGNERPCMKGILN